MHMRHKGDDFERKITLVFHLQNLVTPNINKYHALFPYSSLAISLKRFSRRFGDALNCGIVINLRTSLMYVDPEV